MIEAPQARVEWRVVTELGSAAAQIASIDCAPGAHDAVSLAVTTSPAMVAIGSVADSDFQDMQRPLDPQAARIVQLPLARVDAWAELTLSDLAEKRLDFSRSAMAGRPVKTVQSWRTRPATHKHLARAT